jgi:hypothetical protein
MKVPCYLVERFNDQPPILGADFPISPYAFVVRFPRPERFVSELEAQKCAACIVENLLGLDQGAREAFPNEYISTRMIDVKRLGQPLAIPDGTSEEWAVCVPPGSCIPRTFPRRGVPQEAVP